MTSAYAADPVFESNPKLINNLVQRIHDRDIALPDFQRDFVWDSKAVLELLRSVMSRFPAGTLLFWKQPSGAPVLAARQVEGAPELGGHHPDELVLDGQQRLTSLFRALTGQGDDKYFARLSCFVRDSEVLDVHEVPWDEALVSYDTSTKLKFDPCERDYQLDNHLFPLYEIAKFHEWLDDYAARNKRQDDPEVKIKSRMRQVHDTYLVPLRSYGFPVVTLPASTPIEGVCNIFETLNRTGKPLGAFDLITARLFPQGIHMRDLWDAAVDSYPLFSDYAIEPYSLLQTVSLRSRSSAQRVDVLTKLTASDITEHWAVVAAATAGLLDALRSEYGVISKRWLPYGMLLVPMAAVWHEISELKPLERGAALERLKQYFWCTTFMTNYDQGANSQAGADYIKLREWIFDPEKEAPEAVSEFRLSRESILTANVRRKALHAGIMALTVKGGAKDFHTAQKITPQAAADRKIESHHIFPRAFLDDQKLSERILNRALIDSETNKIIGKNPPSKYLDSMRTSHSEEKLKAVLESHAINSAANRALDSNDYDTFIQERLASMIELIEAVTGMEIPEE